MIGMKKMKRVKSIMKTIVASLSTTSKKIATRDVELTTMMITTIKKDHRTIPSTSEIYLTM